MVVRIIPSTEVWPQCPLFDVTFSVYIYILASLDITSLTPPDLLWSPRQWKAEKQMDKVFSCLSLGSAEQTAGQVFCYKLTLHQLEFFAFLGFKQGMRSYYEMANLFELVIPVMLCSVQHEFVQGHILPFNTRIFWTLGLGDGERILTAVCLPDELSRETPLWNAPLLRQQAWTTKHSYIWVVSTTFTWIFREVCSNNFKGYCVLNVWFLSCLLIKLDLNASFELLGFFVIISGPERL